MKTRIAIASLVVLFFTAALAHAQVPLPVNKGTVFKSYYSYTGTTTTGYTYTGVSTASTLFAGSSSSAYGSYNYRFVDQAVVAVSLSPGGSRLPSVSSATLSFYSISSISGTWKLWVQTMSPNGTISTSDWVSGSAPYGFSLVGSQQITYSGTGTLVFGITSQLNNDLGTPGRRWSSYTLTKTGPLTGMGLAGTYTSRGPVPIPEPATFALFGMGLVTLFAGHRWRRRQRPLTPRE